MDLASCRDGRLSQRQATVIHRDLRLSETGQPIFLNVVYACFEQRLVLKASAGKCHGIDL